MDTKQPNPLGRIYIPDEPDEHGFITPTGASAGGHAYVLNGVNTDLGIFRIKNSWGRQWGDGGTALIKISDFADLMADYGEVCLAEEVQR